MSAIGGFAAVLVVWWLITRVLAAGAPTQAQRWQDADAAFAAEQRSRADGYEWNPDAMRWDRRR